MGPWDDQEVWLFDESYVDRDPYRGHLKFSETCLNKSLHKVWGSALDLAFDDKSTVYVTSECKRVRILDGHENLLVVETFADEAICDPDHLLADVRIYLDEMVECICNSSSENVPDYLRRCSF